VKSGSGPYWVALGVAAIGLSGVYSYERGRLVTWEIALSSEIATQQNLKNCVTSNSMDCVRIELNRVRAETESMIVGVERDRISDSFRKKVNAYRSRSASSGS
jgi:hypothetical protein